MSVLCFNKQVERKIKHAITAKRWSSLQYCCHQSTTAVDDYVLLITCICPLTLIINCLFNLRKNTDEVALLAAVEASKRWPQMVIRFYEDKLTWHGDDEQWKRKYVAVDTTVPPGSFKHTQTLWHKFTVRLLYCVMKVCKATLQCEALPNTLTCINVTGVLEPTVVYCLYKST